jgi:hypothetical protein
MVDLCDKCPNWEKCLKNGYNALSFRCPKLTNDQFSIKVNKLNMRLGIITPIEPTPLPPISPIDFDHSKDLLTQLQELLKR